MSLLRTGVDLSRLLYIPARKTRPLLPTKNCRSTGFGRFISEQRQHAHGFFLPPAIPAAPGRRSFGNSSATRLPQRPTRTASRRKKSYGTTFLSERWPLSCIKAVAASSASQCGFDRFPDRIPHVILTSGHRKARARRSPCHILNNCGFFPFLRSVTRQSGQVGTSARADGLSRAGLSNSDTFHDAAVILLASGTHGKKP